MEHLPHSQVHDERTVPIIMVGCIAHARNGQISTTALKFDVTIVFLDPDLPRFRFFPTRQIDGNESEANGRLYLPPFGFFPTRQMEAIESEANGRFYLPRFRSFPSASLLSNEANRWKRKRGKAN